MDEDKEVQYIDPSEFYSLIWDKLGRVVLEQNSEVSDETRNWLSGFESGLRFAMNALEGKIKE